MYPIRIAALVFLTAGLVIAQEYTLTDLGTLGGYSSSAEDINASGVVVGLAGRADLVSHAFVHRDGAMTDLEPSFGTYSKAFGITDAGRIAGVVIATEPAGDWHYNACIWEDGRRTVLGRMGGRHCEYASLNGVGQVAGTTQVDVDPSLSTRARAFLWQDGYFIHLGTLGGDRSWAFRINDAGQIVGKSENAEGRDRAYLWQNGVMRDLGLFPGVSSAGKSAAYGVNAKGHVVGMSWTSSQTDTSRHAFLWKDGVLTDLGALTPDGPSEAFDLNDAGDVVGASGDFRVDGDSFTHAVIWKDGVLRDLNALIPGGSSWVLTEARAINEAGQIVGVGLSGGAVRAFLLTPVATAGNRAPVAGAGPDQRLTMPGSFVLSGSATDDGLPALSSLTCRWTLTSSPWVGDHYGSLAIGDATSLTTRVSALDPGTYVFQLAVSDGEQAAYDTVAVTLQEEPYPSSYETQPIDDRYVRVIAPSAALFAWPSSRYTVKARYPAGTILRAGGVSGGYYSVRDLDGRWGYIWQADTETAPAKPAALSQLVEIQEGRSAAFTLRSTGGEGLTLTYRVVEPPLHGLISGEAPNLTYAPEAGHLGSDQIRFVVNDGFQDSNVASVSFWVSPASTDPDPGNGNTAPLFRAAVNVNGAVVREGPLSEYDIVGSPSLDRIYAVYEVKLNYYRVVHNGMTGWITISHMNRVPPPLFKATVSVPTLNVRKGPGASYTKVGTLSSGKVVKVYAVSGVWYKIIYGGYYRWINGTYTTRQ